MSYAYRCKKGGKVYGKAIAVWVDRNGKEVRRATTTTSVREAERFAAEKERQERRIAEGIDLPPAEAEVWTWDRAVTFWWDERGSKLKSDTVQAPLRKHTKRWNEKRLTEITPGLISGLIDALQGEIGPRSRKAIRDNIGRVFALLIEREKWTKANPARKVAPVKVPKRRRATLTAEQIPLFVKHLKSWDRLFCLSSLFMGFRAGEGRALRWASVDWEQRGIWLERSNESEETKGQHDELVPIPDALFAAFQAEHAGRKSQLVFPKRDGNMRSPNTKPVQMVRRALLRAGLISGWAFACEAPVCLHEDEGPAQEVRPCAKCGGPTTCSPVAIPITFRSLRTTFATLLGRGGVNLQLAKELMRHSSVELTADVYTQLLTDDQRKGTNVLSDLATLAVGGVSTGLVFAGSEKVEGPDSARFRLESGPSDGRGGEIRTHDHLHPKQGPVSAHGHVSGENKGHSAPVALAPVHANRRQTDSDGHARVSRGLVRARVRLTHSVIIPRRRDWSARLRGSLSFMPLEG